MCAWLPAHWHLADRRAVIEDLAEQVDVLRWIDVIMSARQHRDRTDRNARAMGCGIDATSEPRHDHETSRAKVACDPVGEFRPGGRGIARAQRPRSWAAPARQSCRAPQSAVAHRRSSAAEPGSPARRVRSGKRRAATPRRPRARPRRGCTGAPASARHALLALVALHIAVAIQDYMTDRRLDET